jgi:hypothetical protein
VIDPAPEREPPAAEPEVVIDSAPETAPEPPAAEPEVVIDPAPDSEPEEKPKRKRSSGSRKVPKEALADPAPAAEAEVVPDPEPEPEVIPDPDARVEPDPEPEVVPDPESESVPEPLVVVEPEPEPEPPAPDPEIVSEPEPEPAAAEEEPEPKPRKRSSGSRKVPKEALPAAAGADRPPVVGDQVQLKVGGGKYDAGTRGVVVDVFSAGVIVELVADDGRTERLDLPFEAVGPAEA